MTQPEPSPEVTPQEAGLMHHIRSYSRFHTAGQRVVTVCGRWDWSPSEWCVVDIRDVTCGDCRREHAEAPRYGLEGAS